MILKRVTMTGFKSFADKVEAVFTHGITAIVGPNGCGKSNILDAIRWVLGEQSVRMLRGDKMEDVIFSGSDTRKALNMAEVSLYFDNSAKSIPLDFEEIVVTRRLFRSGESQYLINKSPCRLKDIHEIFMDTGVGTSSYSIIEQGQMDKIINSRPVERREIFEEAAGITKYKVKRKEAERKLLFAEENLIRLQDILKELQVQVDKSAKQAEKAKMFQALSADLEKLDTQFTLHKYTRHCENRVELENKSRELEAHHQHLKLSLEELEAKHADEVKVLEKLDLDHMGIKDHLYGIQNEISQCEQSRHFKLEKIKDLNTRLSEWDGDHQVKLLKKGQIHEEKNKMGLELNEIQSGIKEKFDGLDSSSSELSEIEKELEEGKLKLNEIKSVLALNGNRKAELEKNIINTKSEIRSNQMSLDRLQAEIVDLNNALKKEEDQFNLFEHALSALSEQKKLLSERLSENERKLKEKNLFIQELESEMLKLSGTLSEKTSKVKVLSDLKNSYEGFFAGVKGIMLSKQENPAQWSGFIGTVAEIIKVPSKYEVACEVALGSRIQNIVVRTGEDARQGVQFLKDRKLGRATFLPLDLMSSAEGNRNVKNDNRILGRLIDFLEFDSEYQVLLESLVGSYLVVDRIEDAISLVREGYRQFNLITLGGDLIARGGAVTGGETKSAVKGFLSRENEIDELNASISKLQQQIISKNELRESEKRQQSALSGEIENIKDEYQKTALKFHDAERDNQQSTFNKNHILKKISQLEGEMADNGSQMEILAAAEQEHNRQILDLEQGSEQSHKDIAAMEAHVESIYQKRYEHLESHSRRKNDIERMEDKKNQIESTLFRLDLELKEIEMFFDNADRTRTDWQNQIQILKQESDGFMHKLESLNRQKVSTEDKEIKIQHTIKEFKEKNLSFEQQRKEIQASIEEAFEKEGKLKVRLAEIEGQLSQLQEHVLSKYQKNLGELVLDHDYVNSLELSDVPKKIRALDNQIKNIGPVNLDAITELEALEARYNYLKSQADDLDVAKTKLLDIIQKINVSAEEIFKNTFEHVKVYFQDHFSQLFGGGKAELKLLESEDVLEAGIDIVARPPGKKPQTISLLSGGEKALTAVALIFALFKVKPSPFCVLDELDAPLDEANIGRFIELVKQFSSKTQFMVITHNKRTIKASDLLYGVTQQEKGVSKIVSMKFVEEDLDHLLHEPDMQKLNKRIAREKIKIEHVDPLLNETLPEIKPVQLQPVSVEAPKTPEEVYEQDPVMARSSGNVPEVSEWSTDLPDNRPEMVMSEPHTLETE